MFVECRLKFSLMQVVGESGLFTPDDIALVQEAGCGAVCVLFTPNLTLKRIYMHVFFSVELARLDRLD